MLSENTLVINRPVEDVFQFLMIPENNELWMSMIISTIRDETGPVTLGSTWQHQAAFMGRQLDLSFEVTELEPNRRVCVRNVAGQISFYGCYSLRAVNGGTQFTHTLEGDSGSFFRLAEPIVERAGRRQLAADHATLKDLLEARVETLTG